MKTLIKVLLVTVVILALVLPFLNLRAEDFQAAKSEALKEINGLVDRLKNLKNNPDLSDQEKDQQETILRTQVLLKMVGLSQLETTDLANQLEALKLENDSQVNLKNQLLNSLNGLQDYYEKLNQELAGTGTLNLDEIKLLTKGFQAWRNNVYAKNFSSISNFILVFNEKTVLKIADARLEKIIADLNKLDGSKLINKDDFQLLLKAASLNLDNAHLLNKKAEDLLFLAASGTIAADTANNKINFFVQGALKEIKSAYKNFLEISKRVKEIIAR